MNKIKFQDPSVGRDFFLMSAASMQFFNDIVENMQKLALLGGQNYILQGCNPIGGNTVSSGFIVYNGELFYFGGGELFAKAKLHITENPSGEEVYNSQVQTGARITRVLSLSTAGNTNFYWTDLKRMPLSLVEISNFFNNPIYEATTEPTYMFDDFFHPAALKLKFHRTGMEIVFENVGMAMHNYPDGVIADFRSQELEYDNRLYRKFNLVNNQISECKMLTTTLPYVNVYVWLTFDKIMVRVIPTQKIPDDISVIATVNGGVFFPYLN